MSMTFTSAQPLAPFFEQDLSHVQEVLQAGGVALMPTDSCWSMVCLLSNTEAIERVLRLKSQSAANDCDILVDSMQMFKSTVSDLHPRLETLLAYHIRPLSILLDPPPYLPSAALHTSGQVSLRLVKDHFSRFLLENLQEPLFSAFACVAGQPEPLHFGAISSEILQGVDYVTKYRQNDKNLDELPVMVKLLEDQEELDFLRE
jgi:L-threonylcarbamoyladenylate synthase